MFVVMTSRRKRDLNKHENKLNTSLSAPCDCGCEICENKIKSLQQQIIQLHAVLDKRLTRQSLNDSGLSIHNFNLVEKDQRKAKGCSCKKNCSNRCGCVKNDAKCGDHCKCNKDTCKNKKEESDQENESDKENKLDNENELDKENKLDNESNKENENEITENDETFDPMKPRYQLPRSPVPAANNLSMTNDSFRPNLESQSFLNRISSVNTSFANSSRKSIATDLPEELQQPIVDWEKHQAELKECPKCKRKFLPIRVDKHKAACKGLVKK